MIDDPDQSMIPKHVCLVKVCKESYEPSIDASSGDGLLCWGENGNEQITSAC